MKTCENCANLGGTSGGKKVACAEGRFNTRVEPKVKYLLAQNLDCGDWRPIEKPEMPRYTFPITGPKWTTGETDILEDIKAGFERIEKQSREPEILPVLALGPKRYAEYLKTVEDINRAFALAHKNTKKGE